MAKKITGIVSSDKQDKTIVVLETSRRTHPLYGKQYTRSRKYNAHDEKNEAKIGDRVQIIECRPLSRHKSFTLDRIVETGHEKIEITEEREEVKEKSINIATKEPVKAKEETA